jgi:ferrous iron transport protein B
MITAGAQVQSEIKTSFSERLDRLATDKVWGYFISAFVVGGLLLWTFVVGNFFSSLLTQAFSFFQPVDPQISGSLVAIIWNGAIGGLVAGITLIIPFVIPFYLMLSAIENSGILTRVAFMMDTAMHKIGLHGKALIPLILGYGCNVPAIDSTRILETRRERLLAAFAITFAPCAARTIVILGLVAVFVNVWWALALYVIDLLIIFLVGRIALKIVPGESTGLIMEMHTFKVPKLHIIAKQTWIRTKSLIYLVLPIYIFGTAIVQALYVMGVLVPISNFLEPLTVWWLGLPVIAGVLLIFGAIRKEFILLMLVAFYGVNLALYLTQVQFIVLALVAMLYLPCASTIAVLAREFGWKSAGVITTANFTTAIVLGGIAFRLLSLVY